MASSLETAQAVLKDNFPEPTISCFRGIPLEEFEKEDLIRIVSWSQRHCERMQESADQNRRMQRMFAEMREEE